MTIYDCRTHVRMTSMTSSVERTDLNFKISVALMHTHNTEVLGCILSLSLKSVFVMAATLKPCLIYLCSSKPFHGECGGSVVECRTPEREVRGSRPTAAVLCP